ncbi:unnamed protein product [Paramecium sonneborni]|uniref:Uncharacterized protein n=1 Tax=Paramecium sonneborni TaxID=65129 RepID=A0A8S1JT48_9CILI|nr:unnamed protein product [Paramecium sonneborni]
MSRHGDRKLYDEYINCIIFSNKQYINNEQCMNTYFVSWDQRLFPQNQGCNQNKSKEKVVNKFDFSEFGQEELTKELLDVLNTQILENVECDHLIINEKENIKRDDKIFRILDQEMCKSYGQFEFINYKEPNIDGRFFNRFYWIKDMNNYEKYIQEYLKEQNIIQALKCLNHIVDTFVIWMKMYDIIDEYEIYSGYFEHKKDDRNYSTFQEQMMINLGCLRMELNQILSELKEERLIQIWLIHFVIVFLSEEEKFDNPQQEKIVKSIKKEIKNYDKCKYLCSRLQNKCSKWFKGCSWYFFYKEIVNFESSTQEKNNDFV